MRLNNSKFKYNIKLHVSVEFVLKSQIRSERELEQPRTRNELIKTIAGET